MVRIDHLNRYIEKILKHTICDRNLNNLVLEVTSEPHKGIYEKSILYIQR